MELFIEIVKFFIYATIIVFISKYMLVKTLRKIGELLKLKAKTIGNIAGIATSIPELLTVSFSAFSGLMGTSTYNIMSSNIINSVQYMFSVFINKNKRILKNKAIKIDLLLVLFTIIIPIFMLILQIENNTNLVPIFIILFLTFYKITSNSHRLYGEKRKWIENTEISSEINSVVTVEKYTKKEVKNVVIQAVFLAIIGILLYFVGDMLSDTLNNLCNIFNVSEVAIGVLLGVITSIPELITFFESQKYYKNKKEGVIEATRNLLTSNIMNLFIIQTVGIIIYTIFY